MKFCAVEGKRRIANKFQSHVMNSVEEDEARENLRQAVTNASEEHIREVILASTNYKIAQPMSKKCNGVLTESPGNVVHGNNNDHDMFILSNKTFLITDKCPFLEFKILSYTETSPIFSRNRYRQIRLKNEKRAPLLRSQPD